MEDDNKKTVMQVLCCMAQRYLDLKKAIAEGDKDKIIALAVTSIVSSENDIDFSDVYTKNGGQ